MRFCVLIVTMMLLMLSSSCKKGCTDYFASNYDNEAKRDDGSCESKGCTDPSALNHEPSAQVDDGSCEYPNNVYIFNHVSLGNGTLMEVFWEGEYVGGFLYASEREVVYCEETANAIDILDVVPGTYSYSVYIKPGDKPNSEGTEYLSETISVDGSDQCHVILIE